MRNFSQNKQKDMNLKKNMTEKSAVLQNTYFAKKFDLVKYLIGFYVWVYKNYTHFIFNDNFLWQKNKKNESDFFLLKIWDEESNL